MAEEDLLKEALEANRARELLFRREASSIAGATQILAGSLGSGRTLYVVGAGELALIARAIAQAFVAGELGAPLRAIPLASETAHGAPPVADHALVREVRAFVDRGDVLLGLVRDGSPSPVVLALDAARGKGAAALVVSGYPGEGLLSHADALVVVPSRRGTVIAETALSVGHALARLVCRKLGLDSGIGPRERDPFDSQEEKVKTGSSEDAVVAELVAPPARKRRPTSSVELVPLYAEEKPGQQVPPNTIRFRCGSCGATITVDVRFAGRSGQCPECHQDFTIPPAPSSIPQPAVPSVASSSGARRIVQNPAASSAARHRQTPPPVPNAPPGETVERRRARRVTVKDALLCFGKGAFPNDEEQPAPRHALDDLSLTGLSFTIKGNGPPVKNGDALFVFLDFPAFVDRIKVQGDVRRVEPLADRSGFAVGIRFSRFLDDAQAKVRRLVENDALRGVRRR